MYYRNIRPSFQYNEGTSVQTDVCSCCSKPCLKAERIDTEGFFEGREPYCIPCWFEKVYEDITQCPYYKKVKKFFKEG